MGSMLIGFVASNVVWGLVTVCDPHLVSEEAASGSKILRVVKDGTDMVFSGMKLCFACELVAAIVVKEGVKNVFSKKTED